MPLAITIGDFHCPERDSAVDFQKPSGSSFSLLGKGTRRLSAHVFHPMGGSMSSLNWKESLGDRIPENLGREIDIFETQIELRRQGKLDEKVFAETRLRKGIYGQRYDNGHRYDGLRIRELAYPSGDLTKGPGTYWDAPGMVRIKIPYGGVTPEQMEMMADVAEEYSDGILHVTTRQDIQLHFLNLEDSVDLMRRLASVGITTHEACGNSIRNVTGCPLAGVCKTEAFDITPYAEATMRFLLGHHGSFFVNRFRC